MTRVLSALLLIAALAAGLVFALRDAGGPRELLIRDAHALAAADAPGSARVMLTLTNSGPPDRLIGARSAEAGAAELVGAEGAEGMAVPAGGDISLVMEGAHLRLSGIEGALESGRMLPIALEFERGGEAAARARVEAPGAMADMHGAMNGQAVPPDAPTPAVALSAEPIEGGTKGWRLRLELENFEFRKDLVDQPHQPGTGHAHLYLDGGKIGRLYRSETEIGALPPGRHVARVVLNTNRHRVYTVGGAPVAASVAIEVEVE